MNIYSNNKPVSNTNKDSKPMLFISHRHADVEIADMVREWAERWSMGKIEIFQSSHSGVAPTIGEILSEELMKNLHKAQSLILIYTTKNQDWTYCMWECGVAIDPLIPDTKVVVFQCTKDYPEPFRDRVRVNVRDKKSVRKFVTHFLTGTNFFPRYGKALAQELTTDSENIITASEELFKGLSEVIPETQTGLKEKWPALPWIRLSIGIKSVERIKTERRSKNGNLENDILRKMCVVYDSDSNAAKIFGMVSLEKGLTLDELFNVWIDSVVSIEQNWIYGLISQLSRALFWKYPKNEWNLFKEVDGSKWYAPVVNWVIKDPSTTTMYFDVHFVHLYFEEGEKTCKISVP